MTFNIFQIVTAVALFGNILLGFLIFHINPARRANQAFLLTSLGFDFWMACLLIGGQETNVDHLMFWMRYAGVASAILPFTFDAMRLSIVNPSTTARQFVRELWVWALLYVFVIIVCFHPQFVLGLEFGHDQFAQPQYGYMQWFYAAYWILAFFLLTVRCRNSYVRSTGIARTELQFILFASAMSIIVGVSFAQIIPLLTGYKEWIQFTPLCVILLDGIIAYGIATQRIMAIPVVLQRSISYGLLVSYLVLIYVVVQRVVLFAGQGLQRDLSDVAHVIAAVSVALSMAPANGWMQKITHRLFINVETLDLDRVVQQASHILQSVVATDRLLDDFTKLISQSFGASEIYFLSLQTDGYKQVHSFAESRLDVVIYENDPLCTVLTERRKPAVAEMLARVRPDSLQARAGLVMEKFDVGVAVGIFSKKELSGIMLLGKKVSGRIYDETDQHALQLLCDQLSVALENARLYTEVQNGKIYNDILLDSLASGMVAVNADRTVTVFNQQAQKLTGLGDLAAANSPLDGLPEPLPEVLDALLADQEGFRDRDITLRLDADTEVPIRAAGSVFQGHTGDLLGALLVFNDMTVLKKMEEQIRRTDRLSSLGTLSAGMAHEIKNPLVTIKTFTQLLPQQHDDPDFQHTFFDLVGQEVKRIDTIVNRLLNFARPAKAVLRPIPLHEVIENSLNLTGQQMVQQNISLKRQLDAPRCIIHGDDEQLNQTFVNFVLNAIQAMGTDGTLTVRTSIIEAKKPIPLIREAQSARIQVEFQDTGCGISPEEVSRIFDPFFTTKSDGVGLGLSVSHGIIQEHEGTVDVESEQGKGTVFHIQFPLVEEGADEEGSVEEI